MFIVELSEDVFALLCILHILVTSILLNPYSSEHPSDLVCNDSFIITDHLSRTGSSS